MPKIEMDRQEVVRVQRLRGGTIELHGPFAGQIVQAIDDMCLVNIRSTGHFVLQVTGGAIEVRTQRELPLKGKSPTKQAEKLIANLSPTDDVVAAFKKMVQKKTIHQATYDPDSGNYVLEVGPESQKGKMYRIEIVTCSVTEIVKPDKAEKKPEAGKAPDLKPGSIESCLKAFLAKHDNVKEGDRWIFLAGEGCDDEHLKTHVKEAFGPKDMPPVTLEHEGASCQAFGGAKPLFVYQPKDADAIEVSGKKLLALVRDAFGIKRVANQ